MTRAEEMAVKVERLREMMHDEEIDSVVLGGQANFAWLTAGGDNHVALAAERGVASLVITLHNQYLVTDNIEATGWRPRKSPGSSWRSSATSGTASTSAS